jgi:tight adherence protein C
MSPLGGAALGLVGGAGLCVMAARLAPQRRGSLLEARLAPYLSDAPRPSRLLLTTSRRRDSIAGRVVQPLARGLVRRLEVVLGGAGSVRRRLDRLGASMTVEDFRLEQVVWGGLGAAAGGLVGLLLVASHGAAAAAPVVLLTVAGALGGIMLRDWRLTGAVHERERRVLAEFPSVAEMLALAVAAGEGPLGALDRVASLAGGELGRELRRTLADIRAGSGLTHALDAMAARLDIAALTRFVDGIVIAIDRGTPLADVLREQAADVRESGKRALLEAGGRKEIAMMIPVVFLILPTTVFFALFPGYYGLTLSTP